MRSKVENNFIFMKYLDKFKFEIVFFFHFVSNQVRLSKLTLARGAGTNGSMGSSLLSRVIMRSLKLHYFGQK